MSLRNPFVRRRQRRTLHLLGRQIAAVEAYLAPAVAVAESDRPVAFFNASTRIHTLSLNGAYGLLASWALRAAGQPVEYWVCTAGLRPCVLGTDRAAPRTPPPCAACLDLSHGLFPESLTFPVVLDGAQTEGLRQELERLPLAQLMSYEAEDLPLGPLILPSVRWILRRHHLPEAPDVRSLYAAYLASAAALAVTLRRRLQARRLRALVVFNGIFYPEAIARRIAQEASIPVITHEVGLRPSSAFFSHREATFREVDDVGDLVLTPEQDAALEGVLERRFRGEFTMAGVRFWPSMEGLPASLVEKARRHRQLVAVFSNIIFDTSQVHANVLFEDMFAWLDDLASTIAQRPDTLFVLRAHPDEIRRGKESRESVETWFRASPLARLENVVFIGADEAVSSYDLIRTAKFILVYNSSIGLEATILGTAALCAGRARFTQIEAAFVPPNVDTYRRWLEDFLAAPAVEVSESRRRHARAFLYGEWFRASLDLGEFLAPVRDLPGMTGFADFPPARLLEAEACQVLRRGILEGAPFLLPPSGSPLSAPAGEKLPTRERA